MKTKDNTSMIEIFAGSMLEAEIVKSLLSNAEINAFLQDEYLGTIAPWQASAGGAGAVKIFIAEPDLSKAKPVIELYYQNTK